MEFYTFEHDPGHGWLGVSITELLELKIAHTISSYSYWNVASEIVWLEEDCDYGRFVQAKAKLEGYVEESIMEWYRPWSTKHVRDSYHDDDRIRSLPSFDLVAVQQARNAYVDPDWVKVEGAV